VNNRRWSEQSEQNRRIRLLPITSPSGAEQKTRKTYTQIVFRIERNDLVRQQIGGYAQRPLAMNIGKKQILND